MATRPYDARLGTDREAETARPKLKSVATGLIYLAIAWCMIGQLVEDIYWSGLTYVIIALHLVRLMTRGFTSSYDISVGISFLVLYAVYGPNLLLFEDIDPSFTISIFIVFSDAIRALSPKPVERDALVRKRSGSLVYRVGVLLSAVGVTVGFYLAGQPFALMIPLGCGLFFQEGMLRRGQSKFRAWLMFGLLEIAILAYALIFWTGYGRLAIAADLIMPFAVLSAYYPTKIRFWHVVCALPFLIGVATAVRGGAIGDVASHTADGVTDHMKLTEFLRSGFLMGDGTLQVFTDQYTLFFLNWIPRALWPSKPVGDGLYAVDMFWSRRTLGDEFSVSLGFVGDQIFSIGTWYVLGLLAMLATIVVIRHILIKHTRFFHKGPLIAFDATLLTYFWGGMASFGSRAWFLILPMVALAAVAGLFERSKPSKR